MGLTFILHEWWIVHQYVICNVLLLAAGHWFNSIVPDHKKPSVFFPLGPQILLDNKESRNNT
ncbi:MAG: hypothetical protein AB8Y72_03425 [Coxiella-like endosymbiont]